MSDEEWRCYLFKEMLHNRHIPSRLYSDRLQWTQNAYSVILNRSLGISRKKRDRLRTLAWQSMREVKKIAINCMASSDKRYAVEVSQDYREKTGLMGTCRDDPEQILSRLKLREDISIEEYAEFAYADSILSEEACLGDTESAAMLQTLRSLSECDIVHYSLETWKQLETKRSYGHKINKVKFAALTNRIKAFDGIGNGSYSLIVPASVRQTNTSSPDSTKRSITGWQFQKLPLGTSKTDVEMALGDPSEISKVGSFWHARYHTINFTSDIEDDRNKFYQERPLILIYDQEEVLMGIKF